MGVVEQMAGCDWPSGVRGDLEGRPGLVSAAVRAAAEAAVQPDHTGWRAAP